MIISSILVKQTSLDFFVGLNKPCLSTPLRHCISLNFRKLNEVFLTEIQYHNSKYLSSSTYHKKLRDYCETVLLSFCLFPSNTFICQPILIKFCMDANSFMKTQIFHKNFTFLEYLFMIIC